MSKSKAEQLAEKWYPKRWTIEDLRRLVAEEKLSVEAFERITGEDYVS
jgi:hypothetical protein